MYVIPWIYERATELRNRQFAAARKELEEIQWWDQKRIREWQWSQLLKVVDHAYRTVPYYRTLFDRIGLRPSPSMDVADFKRIPILDKSTLRARLRDLVSTSFRRDQLTLSATGGSTGEPTKFYYDHSFSLYRRALKIRNLQWTGWEIGDFRVLIWGSDFDIATPTLKSRLLDAFVFRRAIIPAFQLAPESVSALIALVNKYDVKVIEGYNSALCFIAEEMLQKGLFFGRPIKAVINAAEKLFPYQRSLFQEAFGCRIHDKYGGRELSDIAYECEQGGFHINQDMVFVEALKEDGSDCKSGEVGRLVVTSLRNWGMPFIRYEIGDLAVPKEGHCPCGRGFNLLDRIEGRVHDLIRLPDGRSVAGEFFPHLFKDYDIKRFQVVQESLDYVVIKIVPGNAFEDKSLQSIETVLARFFPGVHFNIVFVTEIAPGPSGKYRFTISHVVGCQGSSSVAADI